MNDHPPLIGIFNSGVGGLSIAGEVNQRLPNQPLLYLADQAHVPYGSRSIEEIRQLSVGISRYLLKQGARVIVVACNTASAAALYHLRDTFPEATFVGMEPAVKPAAEATIKGKVGVLATPATFQGTLYASLIDRYASEITVYQHTCPGLVSEIESARVDGSKARQILTGALEPMLAAGIDQVVLGCTHYPFVLPLIRSIAGDEVEVIDPSPAVARQVERVLKSQNASLTSSSPPEIGIQTTGNPQYMESFLQQFPRLFDGSIEIREVRWWDGKVIH